MVSIRCSGTGKYYFWTDEGKVMWVGGKSREKAISSFLRQYPGERLDYNPSQPRDSRGRFARSTSGASVNQKPLEREKVTTLQKMATDAGIDIEKLSHKARKSVLIKAIETHKKGGDLRQAGLLKPTKAKSMQQPVKKTVTPSEPVRMTGSNAIAVTDKSEFQKLYGQWSRSKEDRDLLEDYIDKKLGSSDSLFFGEEDATPDKDRELKSLEQKIKKRLGIEDFSEANLERISDGEWIRRALEDAVKRDDKQVIAVKDRSENLQSAVVYTATKDSKHQEGHVYINYLATSPWNAARIKDPRAAVGAGARAIAEAVRASQSLGFEGRVKLTATSSAESFYEKMGFVQDGAYLSLTPGKAKDLLKKYG